MTMTQVQEGELETGEREPEPGFDTSVAARVEEERRTNRIHDMALEVMGICTD